MKAMHLRQFDSLNFDASIHDKKLKTPRPSFDKEEFDPHTDKTLSNQMLEAQARKRNEIRMRNG